MALLENRVKTYSTRTTHKKSKLLFSTATPLVNTLTILALLIAIFNTNFLALDKYLVEINGFTYSKIITPSQHFIKSCINFVVNSTSFHNLHNENLYLKSQNQKLINEIQSTQSIKRENAQLYKILNAVAPEANNNLKAKLISQSASNSNYLAVIAAGKKDGLHENQIVIANGYLAGRIVTVGKNYSKLLLVSSYNSRIPVKTKTTELKAILVGSVDNGGYLLHLHSGQKPQEGELILTSGDGSFYPKDIPVAKINKVSGNNITVTLLSDLSATDFVEIISSNNFDN